MSSIMKTQMAFLVVLWLMIFATSAATSAWAVSNDGTIMLNDLIILYDSGPDGALPEDIVDAINGTTKNANFRSSLGSPQSARLMIHPRLPISERQMLGSNNPRILLQQYVVLTYPETIPFIAFDNLIEALKKNPHILWVGKNTSLEWSIAPNDPLFPISGVPNPLPQNTTQQMWYQWGPQSLNLPSAWSYVTGNAYIGALDRGIEFNTATSQAHPDLAANFRLQFSRDFTPTGSPGMNIDESFYLGGKGHGTHVAGIMAAATNNTDNSIPPHFVGVAGTCWNCSLMVGKISTGGSYVADAIEGLYWMVATGVQAINMSFQDPTFSGCTANPSHPWCAAISYANMSDVILVNSSGNDDVFGNCINSPCSPVRPPGNEPGVISVGAVDVFGQRAAFSYYGTGLALVAPGVDILSTFYTGLDWAPSSPWKCGDSISSPAGYGPCSGTSMAAPHITGLVGLLRSANPLLDKNNIKDILTSSAFNNCQGDANHTARDYCGAGMPDASEAVKAALGKVGGNVLPNRLTPLFSFYSNAAQDYFYTTVPQMALAGIYGTLQPQPATCSVSTTTNCTSNTDCPSGQTCIQYSVSYQPVGAATPGYPEFPYQFSPGPPAPGASVYIFTTEHSPFAGAPPLVPLYRLSYHGNSTGNPSHVDHTYATTAAEVGAFKSLGYELDGIEGYIYDNCTPEPSCIPTGAVRLSRRYNPSIDDFAIFPESERDLMRNTYGYTYIFQNKEWIGYVYPNIDSDGDGLIDGFETLIGTCVNYWDTNGDGISDGVSVLQYPYKDPGQCPPPFNLTLTKNGTGTGTVTSVPSGINCGLTCSASFQSPVTLTAIPDATSSNFTGWSGSGINCPGTGTCHFTSTADITVYATFTLKQYTVTPSPGANGSMTPSTPQTVNYNGTTSFTITPNTGYHIGSVSGCNGSLNGSTYTTGPITANCTVTAAFAINTYVVTPSPGPNGHFNPATPQTVNHGSQTTFAVIPDSGYQITSAGGCNGTLNGSTYTTGPITAACTVSATFDVCSTLPARIAGNPPVYYYTTLQAAYDAAIEGATIQTQAVELPEASVIFGKSINVTVEGGYDCQYTTNTGGQTFLKGQLRTSGGTTRLKNFRMEK